jgi:radical SAM superfamily enzyme YgiQ (UPF0313 family)
MKILLINPETPTTFWSFHHALRFIAKKSSEPPLGLLTVAALLPEQWDLHLVDMNVQPLADADLKWADYVFLTGMHIQKKSFIDVVKRCHQNGIPVVAGGPMVTMEADAFPDIEHLILNEAEITLPRFLSDLAAGQPKRIYTTKDFPELSDTPVPKWDLLQMRYYASMSIQYSRGCPYHCDFCSITLLNGKKPRTKPTRNFLAELDALFDRGWRGRVFIVDDNFIGNKKQLKSELLPSLFQWSKDHAYPFNYMTEVSINLADDHYLTDLMVRAGFDATFVGIETTNTASLQECGKTQNQNRDLVASVKSLQKRGLIVSGGFIVGFDEDPQTIFEQQISFIQKSGIVTAMVGLLNAQPGTRLFKRLKAENRILDNFSGDNMDGSINFVPKMSAQYLRAGYRKILENIYSTRAYYQRIKTFLAEYQIPAKKKLSLSVSQLKALALSMWVLGVLEKGRRQFWKFFVFSLLKHPRKFDIAMTMAVYGFHFRRVVQSL